MNGIESRCPKCNEMSVRCYAVAWAPGEQTASYLCGQCGHTWKTTNFDRRFDQIAGPQLMPVYADRARLLSHLECFLALLDDFDQFPDDPDERCYIRARMERELDAAKDAVRIMGTNDPTIQ